MAAINAGTTAPDFKLQTTDGAQFQLRDALARGPVLAIFFKISCPVCQYAMPYFDRLYKAYGAGNVSIVGISQNDKRDTEQFMKHYGVSFPVLLDDTKTFPASNAYGLTTVPTSFWIAQDGEIELSSVSWLRSEFEEMARKVASAAGIALKLVFQPTEQIADFRAG